MGRFKLELFYLFFHRHPTHKLRFLSCRPFVVNVTFSTGLVVSSFSKRYVGIAMVESVLCCKYEKWTINREIKRNIRTVETDYLRSEGISKWKRIRK